MGIALGNPPLRAALCQRSDPRNTVLGLVTLEAWAKQAPSALSAPARRWGKLASRVRPRGVRGTKSADSDDDQPAAGAGFSVAGAAPPEGR